MGLLSDVGCCQTMEHAYGCAVTRFVVTICARSLLRAYVIGLVDLDVCVVERQSKQLCDVSQSADAYRAVASLISLERALAYAKVIRCLGFREPLRLTKASQADVAARRGLQHDLTPSQQWFRSRFVVYNTAPQGVKQ